MDRSKSTADWIAAYQEWTNADYRVSEWSWFVRDGAGEASASHTDRFAAAYLEWAEDARAALQQDSGFRLAADVGNLRAAGDMGNQLDALREAVLLEALRTESDCIHILRQTLDAGGTAADTVRFAFETVERADRLLEDEQRAWKVLKALRRPDPAQSGGAATWRIDAEDDWSHALEDVVADMHALTGQVLALHVR